MWEVVVGASLWISPDFQWILMEFLHVDLTFYPIWHISGLAMFFWDDFQMILHGFAWGSLKAR